MDEVTVQLQAASSAAGARRGAAGSTAVARAALDRLSAIYTDYATALRRVRDADPDPVAAARLGRQAWLWWATGLRLREVGPRRARKAVAARLRERAAGEEEIAGSLLLAADLLEAVLDLLDQALPISDGR